MYRNPSILNLNQVCLPLLVSDSMRSIKGNLGSLTSHHIAPPRPLNLKDQFHSQYFFCIVLLSVRHGNKPSTLKLRLAYNCTRNAYPIFIRYSIISEIPPPRNKKALDFFVYINLTTPNSRNSERMSMS